MRWRTVTIPNPDHLLDQADRLVAMPTRGRPRQVDLRRAISSAYYAVFHTIVAAAADQVVGMGGRGGREHNLVMRSIDHLAIRRLCEEAIKPAPRPAYAQYLPPGCPGDDLRAFAVLFPDLQIERHAADYDGVRSYTVSDARAIIANARQMLAHWVAAPPRERHVLLLLLLFPPRR